ncbi:MAG: hypothetical protein NTY22_08305, partial [Proteobacteria bacterium]|nr:hypothetical protein [Pseudomonadota bacterium]
GAYRPQIEKAKNEFFALSGVVHEDSLLYPERINLFLDWYIFDRTLDDDDLTPVILFYDRHHEKFNSDEEAIYGGMTKSISSLFIVKSVTDDLVVIKDLFSGKKHKVEDSYILSLVNKGDIFQGRLIPMRKGYIFSRGFCFHDPDARNYIEAEIKKIKNMIKLYHQSFMMKLALMKLKVEEYSHVPIKDIYSEQPKVRF